MEKHLMCPSNDGTIRFLCRFRLENEFARALREPSDAVVDVDNVDIVGSAVGERDVEVHDSVRDLLAMHQHIRLVVRARRLGERQLNPLRESRRRRPAR